MSNLYLKEYKNSYINSLVELHKKAFNSFMDVNLWNWKYHKSDSNGVVAIKNSEIVGFYGCIGRELIINKELYYCANICDTMVLPSKRALFTKNGIFNKISSFFIDNYTGNNKKYRFCYGFPSERHIKLGKILGLYEDVDILQQYLWTPRDEKSFLFKIEEINLDTIKSNIDILFQDMINSFKDSILSNRDFNFIKKRYSEHPHFKYKFFGLFNKFNNSLKSIIVVKENGLELEILDIISNKKYFYDSIRLFLNYKKYNSLYIWASPVIGELLPKTKYIKFIANIAVTKKYLPFNISHLKNRWVMMGGESDFR